MVSYINRENLWSESLTKDVLIIYAEGLARNKFDKRIYYTVRHYTKDTCYVLNKSAGAEGEPNNTNKLFFLSSTFD